MRAMFFGLCSGDLMISIDSIRSEGDVAGVCVFLLLIRSASTYKDGLRAKGQVSELVCYLADETQHSH